MILEKIQVLERHAGKRATGDDARGATLLSLMKDTPGAVGQTGADLEFLYLILEKVPDTTNLLENFAFVLRIPWDPFYEIAHERLNYPVLAQIEGFRKAVLREYGEAIGDDVAGAMAGY